MIGIVLCVKFLDRNILPKILISLIYTAYLAFKLNLTIDLKKCPVCYGTELCNFFENQQIQLTWFSFFLVFFNSQLVNFIFHGTFNETLNIVIKRKSRNINYNSFSNDFEVKNYIANQDLNKVQNVLFCPGFKNQNLFFKNVEDKIHDHKLWLDLKNSIEPLLLLFFLKDGGWPVPNYFGSCGDLIVEEYKGKSLTNFLTSNWNKRAYLAIQLLKIAEIFTFKHPKFAFYFTDLSSDNLVVDSLGNISLIDLDNVIIFDKTTIYDTKLIKNTTHISVAFDERKYGFSLSDICSHYLSDHNFFSICKYLFLDPEFGLLRNIPPEVLHGNSELLHHLHECEEPKSTRDRIMSAHRLTLALQNSIKNYKWKV